MLKIKICIPFVCRATQCNMCVCVCVTFTDPVKVQAKLWTSHSNLKLILSKEARQHDSTVGKEREREKKRTSGILIIK